MICPSTRIRKAAIFTGWWPNSSTRRCGSAINTNVPARWTAGCQPDPAAGLHAARGGKQSGPAFPARHQTELGQHRYEIFLTDAEQAWAADFVAGQNLSGRPTAGHPCRFGRHQEPRLAPLAAEKLHRAGPAAPQSGRTRHLFFGGPEEKADHEKIRRGRRQKLFFPKTQNLPAGGGA